MLRFVLVSELATKYVFGLVMGIERDFIVIGERNGLYSKSRMAVGL